MVEDKEESVNPKGNMSIIKKTLLGKDIFFTGEYIQHFNPDEKRNPFSKIYKKKKQDTLDIVSKNKKKKTILDIGGGMGRITLSLTESEQNKLILSDISVDMLKLAINHADNKKKIKIVNADAHHLPFCDNSFDIVIGLDLFCHLDKPKTVLNEFHRVLKDHGILIMDSTNSSPLWAFFYPRYIGWNPINWLKLIKFQGVLPGWENIVKHYPKKVFFSFLHKTGFEIIRKINYGPLICPKWHLAVSKKIT